MIFITSVAGIWCLIFIAKGNVLGQVLAVIFALFIWICVVAVSLLRGNDNVPWNVGSDGGDSGCVLVEASGPCDTEVKVEVVELAGMGRIRCCDGDSNRGVLFHTWMARHSKSYREYNECCYQLHGCSAHVFKEQILRDCIYE